jgi:hypothetical protein
MYSQNDSKIKFPLFPIIIRIVFSPNLWNGLVIPYFDEKIRLNTKNLQNITYITKIKVLIY